METVKVLEELLEEVKKHAKECQSEKERLGWMSAALLIFSRLQKEKEFLQVK